jgi:haloacetate dehalogenase
MNTGHDLFPGFASRRVTTPTGEIFARVGGNGPPMLLLHGYPQTHVCWHKIAPELARHVTLVMPDLRGYGASHCPAGDEANITYSKRAMAAEMRSVMQALGHETFIAAGHDRGGRVAYRMALDFPDAVAACIPIDILPTAEVWARMRAETAVTSYHWAFLAQPKPMPEILIGADPAAYVRHTLASWTADRTLGCFDPRALAAYEAALAPSERIHAVCSDYRAGATVDRQLDIADRLDGRAIQCRTFILWGSDYVGKGGAKPIDIWSAWAATVGGQEVQSGHFLAEENPAMTAAAMIEFLTA